MSTLYELTSDYLELLNLLEDPDGDPQAIEDTLEGLDYEIELKADGYAKIIAQLDADASAADAEIKRLQTRKKRMFNSMDRLKKALAGAMIATGKRKIKTELFSFSIRKTPARVVIDEQYVENLPEKYLIPQDPKIDKNKIKDDIKAGKDLSGIAHLEQDETVSIR